MKGMPEDEDEEDGVDDEEEEDEDDDDATDVTVTDDEEPGKAIMSRGGECMRHIALLHVLTDTQSARSSGSRARSSARGPSGRCTWAWTPRRAC